MFKIIVGSLLGFFLAATAHAQPAAKVRVDALGDPLPPGAVARLGTLRMSHRPLLSFENVLCSPDGKTAVTVGRNYYTEKTEIYLWDLSTGKELPPLDERQKHAFQGPVAFSPDGTILATAAGKKYDKSASSIVLWDLSTNKKICTFDGHDYGITALAFTADGRTIVATDSAAAVRIWDVARRKLVRTWLPMKDLPAGDGQPRLNRFITAALSKDARFLVAGVGASERTEKAWQFAAIWDVTTEKELWRIPRAKAHRNYFEFQFSPDGNRLAINADSRHLLIREVRTGRELAKFTPFNPENKTAINCMAYAPDSKTIAVQTPARGSVLLWDTTRVRPIRELAVDSFWYGRPPFPVAFLPDGASLLAIGGRRLQLWDVVKGQERRPVQNHRGPVTFLSFSADGKSLVSGSEYERGIQEPGLLTRMPTDELLVWNLETSKVKSRSTALELSKKFDVYTISADHAVGVKFDEKRKPTLLNLRDGKETAKLELGIFKREFDGEYPIGGVFVSPKSRLCFIVDIVQESPAIQVFDIKTGRHLCMVSAFRSFHLSDDEKLIAFWEYKQDSTGHRRVVSAQTGQTILEFPKIAPDRVDDRLPFAFSPNGTLVVSADPTLGAIAIWDITKGKVLRRLSGDVVCNCLTWSRDGRMIAGINAVEHDTIHIWEAATGKLRRVFKDSTGFPMSLAFSPDSRLLASGGFDSTVLVWDLLAS